MAKNLVIVESPAKSRTISKFLGSDYNIAASMGHIMDLPKTKMGVDIEDNFKPSYCVIPRKRKVVKELQDKAKQHDKIYLAADSDREGESICWHLKNVLSNGKAVHRVSFNEITKHVILQAFENPQQIDINKVNAQQARRILDRLVGYSISPLLWQKVIRGLSAGRVQSVAVRLIVERENEIKKFKPQEYWDIEAEFNKKTDTENGKFKAKLFKIEDKKINLKSKEEVDSIREKLQQAKFIVDAVNKFKRRGFPNPPFTTSTLQQTAYNKLKFTAKRTMWIAQQLYEGIELSKEEVTGLITYMRTDSVRISGQAIKDVREFIKAKFGGTYLPKKPNKYKSKKSAQEAHEAIRPTYPDKHPEDIKQFLTKDQFRLYRLIWKRFVASQMKPAIFDNTQIFITATMEEKYLFKANGSILKFDGYLRIFSEGKREEALFPVLEENEELKLLNLSGIQHFTKPPARYSEASLVKILEERGIGRPSTYVPIISTVVARDYVRRLKGYLVPTELGIMVTELLIEHFPEILNIKFTAQLEEKLDLIEEGRKDKVDVLKEFYGSFSERLEQAKSEMENIKKRTVSTSKKCKKCQAPMVIKWGRWGRFLSCSRFPECDYSQDLTTDVECPEEECNGKLVQRRSKRGKMFYGCSNFPKCKYTTSKLPEE